MIILKRDMCENSVIKTADNNTNEYLPYCQASFNSDGGITIRNYDRANKNKDEIIILSDTETNAIFRLIKEIKNKFKDNDLPF